MREVFHKYYGPRSSIPIDVSDYSDRGFEHFVFTEVLRDLARDGREHQCSVDLTPRVADRGEDIVITNFTGESLLDFHFAESPATIVIECKITTKTRLNFDHIAANALQLKRDRSIFLLVTNASLTPRSLALLQDQCRRMNTQFLLIDQYNIFDHFPRLASEPEHSNIKSTAQPLISYQVLSNIRPSGPGFTIHLIVRAFKTQRLDVSVKLHSAHDWLQVNEPLSARTLLAHGVASFTLRLVPRGARTKHSASVTVSLSDTFELVEIRLAPSETLVELPLFAKLADQISDYHTRLITDDAPSVLLIHAPSGTGKTRFIKEVARRVGYDQVLWFVVREDETAFLMSATPTVRETSKRQIVSEQDMLSAVSSEGQTDNGPLVCIDDLHLASGDTLDALEEVVFSTKPRPKLILCGRSDPAVRRPRYEAFAHLIDDNQANAGGQLRCLKLSYLSNKEVASAFKQLFSAKYVDLASGLLETGGIKPVEVVQYIHSLLERRFIFWADENRLAIREEHDALLDASAQAPAIRTEILDSRLEFLAEFKVDSFSLLDLFVLLAIADDPRTTYMVLQELREAKISSRNIITFWFDEDETARLALPVHDSIKERLSQRCFNYNDRLHLQAALIRYPSIRGSLDASQLAATYLHERDYDASKPAMIEIAWNLIPVRNISSISLETVTYQELGSLLFFLSQQKRAYPNLLCRAQIARAYLDMHQQDFVAGLVDCLGLLSGADRTDDPRSGLAPLALRQLIAHGLLNSGDSRTAISLMHEVENLLRNVTKSPLAHAIEFDMCDRLLAYYTRQSSFELARNFMLRGRQHAYRTGDERLINISLSSEFHLSRYLDSAEAVRLAMVQRRHAEVHAPPRALIHAELNELFARWSSGTDELGLEYRELLEERLSLCERRGYGHLVPRLDYALAVSAYRETTKSGGSFDVVLDRVARTHRSARRYGYGEYIWLAGNLRLLCAIATGSPSDEIIKKARQLIDDLARDGLNFVGGDYLCFQNIVVLSNALMALYVFGNDEIAWSASEGIHLSPLISSSDEERQRRLFAVFNGGLLVEKYAEPAAPVDPYGFRTILV